MKGQFFMIGAVFFCALLYFGLTPVIQITETTTVDINIVGDNVVTEMPHALNIGINISDPLGTLYDFTEFSKSTVLDRNIDLDCMWVVFSPGDSQVNVSAGNFMGSAKILGINVSGTYKTLYVPDESMNSTTFPVSDPTFEFSVAYDSEYAGAEILSNKTSIYSVLFLQRDDDIVRKELLA